MALPPPYAAYLRVYAPLASLPESQRRRWAPYVAARRAPDRLAAAAREHEAGLRAAVAGRAVPADDGEAFVTVVDGVTYVCPWATRPRAWAALAAFRAGLPDLLADAFLPRRTVEGAAREQQEWLAAHPDEPPGILTATWHVPLRWFALFEPAERILVLTGGYRSLLYRTQLVRARRRLARVRDLLHRTVEDGRTLEELAELAGWLEAFEPRCMVELDYSGLVRLLADDELREDRSAADVAEAVQALERGDEVTAARAYDRVRERWRALAGRENAN